MLIEINHTFLALIPIKSNHEELGDFRPIKVCNTINKILSKELASRIKMVFPKLISKVQT